MTEDRRRIAWNACFVVAILVAAATLRLWGLPRQGLLFYDEALQALEARSLSSHVRLLLTPPRADGPEAPVADAPAVGKHGHVALVALVMCFLGPADWAGSLLSALCGIAAVGVVFVFARALWCLGRGLLALSLLAFSGLHVTYSREGLAESDTILLYLATAYLLWTSRGVGDGGPRPRWGRLALAGLAGGATYVCNFRSLAHLLILFAIGGAELFLDRRASRRGRARHVLILILSLSAAPLACEGVYRLLQAFGHARQVPTYFQDLALYYRHLAGAYGLFSAHAPRSELLTGYLRALVLLDGPFHALFLLLGTVALARRPTRVAAYVLAPALGPLLLYGLYRGGGLRFISPSLPFLALVKAEGLYQLIRLPFGRWGTAGGAMPIARTGGVALACALISLPQLLAPLRVSSPDPRAMAAAIPLLGSGKLVSTRFYVSRFYAPPDRVLFPPDSEWELYQMHQKGARYLLTDHESLTGGFHGPVGDEGLADLVRQIRKSQRPILEFPNDLAAVPQFLMERTVERSQYAALRDDVARAPAEYAVKVFDLAALFASIPEESLRARGKAEFLRRLALREGLTRGTTATYLEKLGYLLAWDGEWDAARDAFEKMLDYAPGSTIAHFNLGLIDEVKGNLRQALDHFDVVARWEPDDAETLNRMGTIHARLQQNDESVACFREAIRRDPGLTKAYLNLGIALRRSGDVRGARLALQEYTSRAMNNPSEAGTVARVWEDLQRLDQLDVPRNP
jgi:Tfp pilus assembly protein PilF